MSEDWTDSWRHRGIQAWLDMESRRLHDAILGDDPVTRALWSEAEEQDRAERDRLRRMFWRDQKGIR